MRAGLFELRQYSDRLGVALAGSQNVAEETSQIQTETEKQKGGQIESHPLW